MGLDGNMISRSILVVHPAFFEPDRNAGDMRTWEILQILTRAGHRVVLLVQQVRDPAWTERLETVGVRLVVDRGGRLRSPEGFARLAAQERFEVAILINYTVFGLYGAAIRSRLPWCARILDTVDLHFVRLQREAELRGGAESAAAARQAYRDEWAAMEAADGVWVVTPEESAIVGKRGLRAVVVPNLHRADADPPGFEHRQGLLFIGSYRHSPNVDAVEYFIRSIHPAVALRLPEAQLDVIGADAPPQLVELMAASRKVTFRGFVQDHRAALRSARVGIVPLRFGAGMKGKICESLCCGLPCVTTSVGAEGMGLRHRETAMIADSPSEFADCVCRLYEDRALWASIAAAGRAHIAALTSPERWAPGVLEAVEGAFRSRRARGGLGRRAARALRDWLQPGRLRRS